MWINQEEDDYHRVCFTAVEEVSYLLLQQHFLCVAPWRRVTFRTANFRSATLRIDRTRLR